MTKRIYTAIICFVGLTTLITSRSTAGELSEFAKKLLVLDPISEEVLCEKSDLIELAPVTLPEGDALVSENDHFGWPIAVKADDAMIVIFMRGAYHFGVKDKRRNPFWGYVAVRSLDGGRTWSKPKFMKDFVKKHENHIFPGMGAIGLDRDGAVVAVLGGSGTYRSEDKGATWEHLPGAFSVEQLKQPKLFVGPRLFTHPKYGLVVAGHVGETKKIKNPDNTPYIPPQLWLCRSQDGGRSWSKEKQDLPEFATAIEPCMLMHDDAMLIVGRCHGTNNVDEETKTRRYVQLWSESGWMPFVPKLTTIRATDHHKRFRYFGPWTQDTVDVNYNPVSRRIECVATDRNGDAGAGQTNSRKCQTMNLWSIDPADLRRGEANWRFEARLLKRKGLMAIHGIDGMHPGAAIMDEKAGVQHIFFYAGKPQGPAGIFRLTRTLDTEKLRREIGHKDKLTADCTLDKDEKTRQIDVFIGGQDGYHTYRIPALAVTKKGSLLAFCEGRKSHSGDCGKIDLLVKRSTDGGQTWSPQQIVWKDGQNTCGNPCPVVDVETGKIWLLLTWNHGKDKESEIIKGEGRDTRRVFVCHSGDDGISWSQPKEITTDVKPSNWTWYATGPGNGIQLTRGAHKGRLVVPCDHVEAGTKKYYSHVIYSDDHGQTWHLGGSSQNCGTNESTVVELDDGRLMLNMRNMSEANRRQHRELIRRAVCFSDDGGLSWKGQHYDETLIEPCCEANIMRYSWPQNGEKNRILFSNPASSKREKMTVRLSYDEGKTWPVAKVLHPGRAAYSSLAVLPDGPICCLYERDNDDPKEKSLYKRITLAILSLP